MEFSFDYKPSDSPYIERIWHAISDQEANFISAAAIHWEIVVWKEDGKLNINVRGPETKASPAQSGKDMEFFGMTFKPGTFMPHLPIDELVNKQMIFPQAGDHSFWLNGAAWEIPTFENADTFIKRLMHDDLLVYEPVVQATMQGQPSNMSLRALQYRFQKATGLTYNTIRQIERAQQAANLLEQGVSIQDTVFATGYFDQAHLTHSLKRFMGQTPAQIAALSIYRSPSILTDTMPELR